MANKGSFPNVSIGNPKGFEYKNMDLRFHGDDQKELEMTKRRWIPTFVGMTKRRLR